MNKWTPPLFFSEEKQKAVLSLTISADWCGTRPEVGVIAENENLTYTPHYSSMPLHIYI